MSLLTKAGSILLVCVAAIGFYVNQRMEAERRGTALERGKVIARANQEIATRRERDAQFDRMDARQHCLDAGLDWVFDDGKSFCR